MNEVSIIINGVRYDSVEGCCEECAFFKTCFDNDTCCNFLGDMEGMIFKKSDKKFEP